MRIVGALELLIPLHHTRAMFNHRYLNVLTFVMVNALPAPADAQNPLASNDWTQVGNMVPDGTMFNGNCNLDLSGACTFSSATDFWRPMPNANQILFITGDRQYWGHAWYADVWSIIQAATAEQFSTNLTWINAGRSGASVGSIQGNVLFREGRFPETGNPFTEDPWVTLEGPHCAPYISPTVALCSEMLWGENAFPLDQLDQQDQRATLIMEHGGIEVWAREYDGSSIVTPEPSTYALMAAGLLGLGVIARRRRKAADA